MFQTQGLRKLKSFEMPGTSARKRGPRKRKKGKKHRKHTPIITEAQRGLMGADYKRGKEGKKKKTGMSQTELKRHLKEAKGKKLPKKSRKRKKR